MFHKNTVCRATRRTSSAGKEKAELSRMPDAKASEHSEPFGSRDLLRASWSRKAQEISRPFLVGAVIIIVIAIALIAWYAQIKTGSTDVVAAIRLMLGGIK